MSAAKTTQINFAGPFNERRKEYARSQPTDKFKYRDQSRMVFLAKRKKVEMAKRWNSAEVNRAIHHRISLNRNLAKKAFRFRDLENTGFLTTAQVHDLLAWFNIEMIDEDFHRWWIGISNGCDQISIAEFFSTHGAEVPVDGGKGEPLSFAFGGARHAQKKIEATTLVPIKTAQEVRKALADHCVTRLDHVQKTFGYVDSDRDGKVTMAEFARVLADFNVQMEPADLVVAWREMTNNSPLLDWQAFLGVCSTEKHGLHPSHFTVEGVAENDLSPYDSRMTTIMQGFAPDLVATDYGPWILPDGHMGAFVGTGLSGAFERTRAKAVAPKHKLSTARDVAKIMKAAFRTSSKKIRRMFRQKSEGGPEELITRESLRELIEGFLISMCDAEFNKLCDTADLGEYITYEELATHLGGVEGVMTKDAQTAFRLAEASGGETSHQGIEWGVSEVPNKRALDMGFLDVNSPLCAAEADFRTRTMMTRAASSPPSSRPASAASIPRFRPQADLVESLPAPSAERPTSVQEARARMSIPTSPVTPLKGTNTNEALETTLYFSKERRASKASEQSSEGKLPTVTILHHVTPPASLENENEKQHEDMQEEEEEEVAVHHQNYEVAVHHHQKRQPEASKLGNSRRPTSARVLSSQRTAAMIQQREQMNQVRNGGMHKARRPASAAPARNYNGVARAMRPSTREVYENSVASASAALDAASRASRVNGASAESVTTAIRAELASQLAQQQSHLTAKETRESSRQLDRMRLTIMQQQQYHEANGPRIASAKYAPNRSPSATAAALQRSAQFKLHEKTSMKVKPVGGEEHPWWPEMVEELMHPRWSDHG